MVEIVKTRVPAGWRKGDGEFRRWLIPPEVWRIEVCGGLDSISVARELAKRGMLEKGNDGNSKVEKIAGTSKRVYVVTPRIFDGAFLTSDRADDHHHEDLGRPINAWIDAYLAFAHVCAAAALGDARAMDSSHSAARYFQPDFDGVSGRLSGFTSALRNMIESC
jgi:hypothetical protein